MLHCAARPAFGPFLQSHVNVLALDEAIYFLFQEGFMKIALAQINPIINDFTGNMQKMQKYIKKAKDKGSELIVFPELSFCGYPPRDLLLREDFINNCINAFEKFVSEIPDGIGVLVGSISKDDVLYNSAFLIYNRKILFKINKSLLPEYDVFDEKRYFTPCFMKKPIKFKGLSLGITICEDIWIEEQDHNKIYKYNPVEDLTRQGIDILINISASPFTKSKPNTRYKLLASISEKYGIPIVYTNTVGANDSLIFDGFSMAYHPKYGDICHLPGFAEAVDYYDTDKLKALKPIEYNTIENIINALVLGVRDYLRKNGFREAIIGSSGGIDSALVTYIASRAIGGENVLCISMPSEYSSKDSIKDAEKLSENLKNKFKIIPITDIYRAYIKTLEKYLPFDLDITYQNIQARIRGNILMAFSNRQGSLLLTTANKSESSVGYSTLYGDMAGGLSVLSDVTKTDIYKIAEYINRDSIIIPENIINKAPSAELKPDQKDSDELPSYEHLDHLIETIIEESRGIDEIKSNIPKDQIERFIRLYERAEFKRQQAPPGLKISSKAFGYGRRFPIAMKKSI